MGLKALTLSAVGKLRAALGDLAVDMTLRTRVQSTYVAGQPISYSSADLSVKGVITRFRDDEIDGTMIQRTDLLIILFPPSSGAIPKPNDVLIHGENQYRVVNNRPTYAGSEIAINLIQARPPA
jgi:hypothetical protein